MTQSNTTSPSPVLAILIAICSVGWLSLAVKSGLSHVHLLAIGLVLAIGGFSIANSIRKGSARNLGSFSLWALLHVIGFVMLDAQVEPVWWKLALGSLPTLAIVIFGWLHVRESQVVLRPGTPD